MWSWPGDASQPASNLGRSRLELAPQMLPLVIQLPTRLANPLRRTALSNLARVELVAATLSFGCKLPQKRRDCGLRMARASKAQKLWMIPVTAPLTAENLLRKQRLSPLRTFCASSASRHAATSPFGSR
jgi:hypothetical protein